MHEESERGGLNEGMMKKEKIRKGIKDKSNLR
jgi:hypothetical protein